MKRFDEAISLYRKNNGNSGQEYASYQIANIYFLKNELERAQKMQKEALSLYKDEIKDIMREVEEKQAAFSQSDAYQGMKESTHKTMQNLKHSMMIEKTQKVRC